MTIADLVAKHGVIAVDSNVLIYLLEDAPLGNAAAAIVDAIERGDVRALLSALGLAEVLSGPARQRDPTVFEAYAADLRTIPHLRITVMDAETAIDAAWLRGNGPLALPDAIHLASARRNGATAFITNDRRIRSRPNLEVILLDEVQVA